MGEAGSSIRLLKFNLAIKIGTFPRRDNKIKNPVL